MLVTGSDDTTVTVWSLQHRPHTACVRMKYAIADYHLLAFSKYLLVVFVHPFNSSGFCLAKICAFLSCYGFAAVFTIYWQFGFPGKW